MKKQVHRSQSFEARAKRRNTEIAKRNQKKADANPLFAAAGILEQVVQLDQRHWDALSVAYGEIGIGIKTYEDQIAWERRSATKHAMYCQMLTEAIGAENVEEVLADYDQRWPKSHPMQQWEYRNNYLNNYLARYTNRTPLDIFEEANQRLAVSGNEGK